MLLQTQNMTVLTQPPSVNTQEANTRTRKNKDQKGCKEYQRLVVVVGSLICRAVRPWRRDLNSKFTLELSAGNSGQVKGSINPIILNISNTTDIKCRDWVVVLGGSSTRTGPCLLCHVDSYYRLLHRISRLYRVKMDERRPLSLI